MSGDTSDRVQLNAWISAKTREKLYRYVARQYDKAYGALGDVVDEAIIKYIVVEGEPNTHEHKKRPPRGHEKAMKVIHHIRAEGFTLQFHVNQIREAIKAEIGFDPRTVLKWHHFLVENKYITLKAGTFISTFGPMSGFEPITEEGA